MSIKNICLICLLIIPYAYSEINITYMVNYCNLNISGQLPIDRGEYVLYGECSETVTNYYECNCSDKLKLGLLDNTINNYTIKAYSYVNEYSGGSRSRKRVYYNSPINTTMNKSRLDVVFLPVPKISNKVADRIVPKNEDTATTSNISEISENTEIIKEEVKEVKETNYLPLIFLVGFFVIVIVAIIGYVAYSKSKEGYV